jgi:ABC-type antimicrobial peptide transport system permease subunit
MLKWINQLETYWLILFFAPQLRLVNHIGLRNKIQVYQIAYYYMNKWLQNVAFLIQLSWWMFIIAGIVTLSIALITLSIQTYKAAKGNPVKSLRVE